MPVWLRNFQRKVILNEPLLKMHCYFLMDSFGLSKFDVSVVCTSTSKIQSLNKIYRNMDEPTDVLSFPYHEVKFPGKLPTISNPDDLNLGDIILGIPYINNQCIENNINIHDHLPILITHGICHLLGYRHDTVSNAQQMYYKEQVILRSFNNAFGTKVKPLTYTANNILQYNNN